MLSEAGCHRIRKRPASKKSADSTKASRTRFLTTGAGAAALGAVRTATGQTPTAETKSLKDQVAYGDRSHYVTCTLIAPRIVPQGLYERVVKLLGDTGLTDLTVLIGYFTSISMTLAAYDVPSDAVGLKR